MRRRVVGFGVALLVGVVIGMLLWPSVHREIMLRRLFSEDAAERGIAVQWWEEVMNAGEPRVTRLQRYPSMAERMARRLDDVESQERFVAIASLLRATDSWDFPLISIKSWARRLGLILDSDDEAAARSVLDELAQADVSRDDESALAIWQRVLEWKAPADVRRSALLHAARWFGREGIESYAAAARDDADPAVQRVAWLLLGHVQPTSGYAGQWRGQEPAVAEAMLWAATVTNRDDATALLTACDASPWPTVALTWLLSRSDDPAARERLEELIVDGNRSAMLHLAERWGVGVDRLPFAQQAWLGEAPVGGRDEQELRWRRWASWRTRPTDVEVLLEEPLAEDGSVWAAVLLAERLLDDDAREKLARRWLDSLEPAMRGAGALLAGLVGGAGWRLTEAYQESSEPAFRRAARLGMLMVSANAESAKSEHAYAWTIAMTQGNERIGALMALLASADAAAAEAVLTAPADGLAGAALLERAWLIERFLPDYASLVAPLCPWNDDVAALQFDIMRTAFALGGGSDSFDRTKRVFVYAAATPSR